MEKVYITGSTGFLGSHLIKRFKDPICIPHEEIRNIKLQPYDRFFFLSAYGNMSWHNDDEKTFQANIKDLLSILTQKATYKGFKSFTFVSTSSVRLPVQTMYSRTKRAAEEILLSFMEKHNVPIQIIRPFSITGVGEQKEHLIPKLIESSYDGSVVNLVPEPVHDFIDVEDVVDGILSLSDNSARGIFELGTGIQHSNLEIKEIVEKIAGKINVNIVTQERDYDTTSWVSTNFKARGYGWLPKKKLEQSIKEMVDARWYELHPTQ